MIISLIGTASSTLLRTVDTVDLKRTTTTTSTLRPAPTLNQLDPTLSRATTTSTQSTVRCERVQDPSDEACAKAYCPNNQVCAYTIVTSASGAVSNRCVCTQATSTTQPPSQLRCEAIQYASADRCSVGVCPPGQVCRVVTSTAVTHVSSVCKCVPQEDTTTTTLQYTWCEDLTNPSERMCMTGLCPPNRVCRYMPAVQQTLTHMNAPAGQGCVCVPCESQITTTTLPVRCESVENPSARTCSVGVCPPNTRCVYKPGSMSEGVVATHVVPGSCECEPYVTTTTVPPRCDAIAYASPRACAAGLCPPDMDCIYRPGSMAPGAVATHYVPPSCECAATTTTLPTQMRCEALSATSAGECVEGVCPPEYDCRYVTLASAAVGACRCVLRSSTTTTLPGVTRCEAVDDAGLNTCAEAVCPGNLICRYIPSPTAANVGECVCINPPTTTQPGQVRCEAFADASANACVEGVCPPDYKCRYVPSPTAAGVGSCQCIPPTSTTMPGEIKCEAIDDASEKTCAAGLCPPEHSCRYIQTPGAAGECSCILEEEAPPTVSEVRCEAVEDPSEKTCAEGVCPQNHVCRYLVDDAGNDACVCRPTTPSTLRQGTTTTLRRQGGFVQGIMDTLFGWL